jgi:hypothetical protein
MSYSREQWNELVRCKINIPVFARMELGKHQVENNTRNCQNEVREFHIVTQC